MNYKNNWRLNNDMARGVVDANSFTHGSSEAKKEVFNSVFESHDLEHSMSFYENLEFQPQIMAND
ncbi:hypothetical protein [uncultured Peptoniphilus sp.]|uniref:hypothetical protein n=2 Tax=Peptoniphilus TaxID=162289 RepID=UPI002803DBEF|nr:hypothetical protein [uncultured Peptoniphilus sp.]